MTLNVFIKKTSVWIFSVIVFQFKLTVSIATVEFLWTDSPFSSFPSLATLPTELLTSRRGTRFFRVDLDDADLNVMINALDGQRFLKFELVVMNRRQRK